MTTRSPGSSARVQTYGCLSRRPRRCRLGQLPRQAHSRKAEARTERATLGNAETASSQSSIEPAPSTSLHLFLARRASVLRARRFLDQKGNVYLLKTMSSWAMAQNSTNAEIAMKALEGLKEFSGFNAVDGLTVWRPHAPFPTALATGTRTKPGKASSPVRRMIHRSARRGRRWTGSCQKPPGFN